MKQLVYTQSSVNIYRYKMPVIGANMFVLIEDGEALILDPNINADALALLESCGVQNILILLTHEHFDHISGVNWLREHFETKVYCSAPCAANIGDSGKNMAKLWRIILMDKPPEEQQEGLIVVNTNYTCSADEAYEGEMVIRWHAHTVKMMQAPGHSQGGSLIFLDEGILFSGDNLVEGDGVICRLPGGNKRIYMEDTRPLLEALDNELFVFPGHGEPDKLGNLRQYLNLFKSDAARAGTTGKREV